jgi:hypothetical protein
MTYIVLKISGIVSDYQQEGGGGGILRNWSSDHALSDVATYESKLASGLCVSKRH